MVENERDNQELEITHHSPSPITPVDTTIGPIIGSLIIVVMLTIGALYFWGQKLNKDEHMRTLQEEQMRGLNTSDDLQSIKRDLEETSIDTLDQNLKSLQ